MLFGKDEEGALGPGCVLLLYDETPFQRRKRAKGKERGKDRERKATVPPSSPSSVRTGRFAGSIALPLPLVRERFVRRQLSTYYSGGTKLLSLVAPD